MAAMFGYGHVLSYGSQWRKVVPGAYPYKPGNCRRADWGFGAWVLGGTRLVCTGCGLDFT